MNDKEITRKQKQAAIFDKGIKLYLIRAGMIGGIGGLVFGLFLAFTGEGGFDFLRSIESIPVRRGLTILICTLPFAFVGIRVAWRNWQVITWDTFTLPVSYGDTQESIIRTFGPATRETQHNDVNDVTELFYATAVDQQRHIRIDNLSFFFQDNKLIQYERY